MISDILFDAVSDINEWLADDTYTGPQKDRIIAVRDAMILMQHELDGNCQACALLADDEKAYAAKAGKP